MGNQPADDQKFTYNEEIPNSKREGFSPIFRKKGIKTFIETPSSSISSMRNALNSIKDRFGPKEGLGEVIVSKEVGQNGEEIETRSIKAHTYNEIYESAYNLGRAIFAKRLYFEQPLQRMKLIGIYSKNRYEWFVTDWACVLFGITSVPLYDTLGVQNLSYCLNQTEMTTLFISSGSLKTFLELKDLGKVTNIISFDPLDEATVQKLNGMGIICFSFGQLIEEGSKMKQITFDLVAIKKEDCYTFSYTSGTTGPPKGAMISHRNFLSGICCFFEQGDMKFNPQDRYISYLPLPHLMERLFSFVLLYQGAYVVISSGNTLKLKDDCEVVKPTIFLSVPRIFNRISEALKNKFDKETGLKKCLIDKALETKIQTAKQSGQFSHCLYDSLIFSKVKDGFGGKIRALCTGSAPINPEVQALLKVAFACPFIEGYGQTQNTGLAILNRAMDTKYGTLCEISTGLEVKLCDIPQMKYTYNDLDEEGKPAPKGQIWLRGPLVFKGYYKLPEITKEAINQEGWLKTGDVAQYFPERKSFKIIDRRKNIFKLQQGEYLAPDRIENKYLKSKLISEIFLHGDSQQYFAVAIITPNTEGLEQLAASKGIPGSHSQLCRNPQIRRLLLIEVNEVGKGEGLHGFELAKNVYLEEKNFQSRGILTNTMKLIRYEARQVYKEQIKSMYQEGELPTK